MHFERYVTTYYNQLSRNSTSTSTPLSFFFSEFSLPAADPICGMAPLLVYAGCNINGFCPALLGLFLAVSTFRHCWPLQQIHGFRADLDETSKSSCCTIVNPGALHSAAAALDMELKISRVLSLDVKICPYAGDPGRIQFEEKNTGIRTSPGGPHPREKRA